VFIANKQTRNVGLQNIRKKNKMSKSRHNTLQNKCRIPTRDTIVDCDSLLGLIANELDVCIRELRERRRGILEVRQELFPSDKPFEAPSDKGLKSLSSELGGLEHGIGRVVLRFDQFRAKLFQDVANDTLRDRKEAYPYFDLDSE
jgi:hypothetical protein